MDNYRNDIGKAKIIDHAICLQCLSGNEEAKRYLIKMGIDEPTIERVLLTQASRSRFCNRTERFKTRTQRFGFSPPSVYLFLIVFVALATGFGMLLRRSATSIA